MAICVRFEPDSNRLSFKGFPAASLEYQKDRPQDDSSSISLQVTDSLTEKISSIFLKSTDLQDIGISLTVWKDRLHQPEGLSKLIRDTSAIDCLLYLATPTVSRHRPNKYFCFFENIPYTTRLINLAIHKKIQHLSGKQKPPEMPGMYFDSSTSFIQIFINLKGTTPLGQGNLGKVRKVLWLNPPDANPTIAAKKVLRKDRLEYFALLQLEIDTLREFSGKRGIISLIAAGNYNSKLAIFLPVYERTLYQRPLLLLNEKLAVISQWLEGLATISKKGVHGDLSFNNLYLRRGEAGIEGVIADFNSYRPHGKEKHGLTTPLVAPPEYYTQNIVTSKHDVWAMGLALHDLFSMQELEHCRFSEKDEIRRWISKLRPGWILQRPTHSDTPPFVLQLINKMLDPRPEHRCTAKEAFDEFSVGYSVFVQSSREEFRTRQVPSAGRTVSDTSCSESTPVVQTSEQGRYSSLADKSSTEDLAAKEDKHSAPVAPPKPVNAISCTIF